MLLEEPLILGRSGPVGAGIAPAVEEVSPLAALTPIFEHHINDAGIGQRRVVVEWRHAADGDDAFHSGVLPADLRQLINHVISALERCTIWQQHRHHHVALVFRRDEAGRNLR